MNNDISQAKGYLLVKVSTARGAIPLEGAQVIIRGAQRDSSDVIYSLLSDRSGSTPRVALPAPRRILSQSPESLSPYALYSVVLLRC